MYQSPAFSQPIPKAIVIGQAGATFADDYPALAAAVSRPVKSAAVSPRKTELIKARIALKDAAVRHAAAKVALGESNKMGTSLNRSECMSELNRARHARIKVVMAVNALLGRVNAKSPRKSR